MIIVPQYNLVATFRHSYVGSVIFVLFSYELVAFYGVAIAAKCFHQCWKYRGQYLWL